MAFTHTPPVLPGPKAEKPVDLLDILFGGAGEGLHGSPGSGFGSIDLSAVSGTQRAFSLLGLLLPSTELRQSEPDLQLRVVH